MARPDAHGLGDQAMRVEGPEAKGVAEKNSDLLAQYIDGENVRQKRNGFAATSLLHLPGLGGSG